MSPGSILRALRGRADLSLEEVAARLDCGLYLLVAVEDDQVEDAGDTIHAAAVVCGATYQELAALDALVRGDP